MMLYFVLCMPVSWRHKLVPFAVQDSSMAGYFRNTYRRVKSFNIVQHHYCRVKSFYFVSFGSFYFDYNE